MNLKSLSIKSNSIITSDYSKHGIGINEYIAKYHPQPLKFKMYRYDWENNNANNLLFFLLETISSCNLKCLMCSHSVGYKKTKKMDNSLFDIVIQNIKDMNIPSICMNQINEPLLDKLIINRIKKVNTISSVVDIFMNTNGTYLTDKISEQILTSGLTRLLIGFDGYHKSTYEKIRFGANYDNVLKNILNFLELKEKLNKKLPVVRISFVRLSHNENEIDKWINFWKDKVDYLTVQEYLTPISNNSKDYLIAKSSQRKNFKINELSCEQPFQRAVVRGNGDIIPCCSHMAVDMPIGNLREKSLKEIWYGREADKMRKIFLNDTWTQHPICSKCLMLSSSILK